MNACPSSGVIRLWSSMVSPFFKLLLQSVQLLYDLGTVLPSFLDAAQDVSRAYAVFQQDTYLLNCHHRLGARLERFNHWRLIHVPP